MSICGESLWCREFIKSLWVVGFMSSYTFGIGILVFTMPKEPLVIHTPVSNLNKLIFSQQAIHGCNHFSHQCPEVNRLFLHCILEKILNIELFPPQYLMLHYLIDSLPLCYSDRCLFLLLSLVALQVGNFDILSDRYQTTFILSVLSVDHELLQLCW